MGALPEGLIDAVKPVTVVAGHYGAGKTNFTVNLALDLKAGGCDVTVIDLDIVNPYFRASEQRAVLEAGGVRLIAPVFSEVGTSLDVPSLTGEIVPAIQCAREGNVVLVDAGGDDAGSAALGRYSRPIAQGDFALLYVANRFRNLVQDPRDALENLREIEAAARLNATAIANNSHLKQSTSAETVEQGFAYAHELSDIVGLPLACTTVPEWVGPVRVADEYRVRQLVKTPWE